MFIFNAYNIAFTDIFLALLLHLIDKRITFMRYNEHSLGNIFFEFYSIQFIFLGVMQ